MFRTNPILTHSFPVVPLKPKNEPKTLDNGILEGLKLPTNPTISKSNNSILSKIEDDTRRPKFKVSRYVTPR